jgi:hypothetical protein
MMEVSIILKGIRFDGLESEPRARTAVIVFEIKSDDFGPAEFNVEVIPAEGDDADQIDNAIIIARRTLVEFGKALAAAAEKYEPPVIYSPKSP